MLTIAGQRIAARISLSAQFLLLEYEGVMNDGLADYFNMNDTVLMTAFVMAGIVALAILWFLYSIVKRDAIARQQVPPETGLLRRSGYLLLSTMMAIAVVGVLFALLFGSGTSAGGATFAGVAALILVGIGSMLAILNWLSGSMEDRKLSDRNNPFGLPEGSVRAILTISFIVLVGVLAAYLITSHNNRSPFRADGKIVGTYVALEKANTAAAAMRNEFRDLALITVMQVEGEEPRPYQVMVFPRTDNSMGDDIAKQTLTMISTILAAMIGFYFGERGGTGKADPTAEATLQLRKGLRPLALEAEVALDLAAKTIGEARKAAGAAGAAPGEAERVAKAEAGLKVAQESLKSAKKILDDETSQFVALSTVQADLLKLRVLTADRLLSG